MNKNPSWEGGSAEKLHLLVGEDPFSIPFVLETALRDAEKMVGKVLKKRRWVAEVSLTGWMESR